MPVIITYGIILPSGLFLPNGGDGHAKNAIRFCEKYPALNNMKDNAVGLPPDEFMLCAGCGIVAGYRGQHCFKYATNGNDRIKRLAEEYKMEGFKIMPYWEINTESAELLNDIIKNMTKMQITVKEQ